LDLKKDNLVPVSSLVPVERVESRILFIRGEKVMLDADLAGLYGVETRALVQAVKRNIERFPADFMFQLTDEEAAALRRHYGTSNTGDGQFRCCYRHLSEGA
jgi:hypothetical protein